MSENKNLWDAIIEATIQTVLKSNIELISMFVDDMNDCFDNGIFNLSMFRHKKRKWEEKLK